MIFSNKQLLYLKKLSGNTPGANHIGVDDLPLFKKILKNKAPYRFSGNIKKPICNTLEDKFKKYLNRKNFLLVSSGTAALHLALEALDLKKSDEIIIPAYGWSADLMAVIACKAKPVLAPIGKDLGLDINFLEKIINRNTKAIIAIHMRGKVCDIINICSLAKKKGVKVIEDCSQCFGGELNSSKVGSFGDISTFSFQYNKLLTAGEGGGITTNDHNYFKKINNYHDLGMGRLFGDKDPVGIMAKSLGLNYHYNELSAALLLSQFNKKNLILKNLEKNYNKIEKIFEQIRIENPVIKFSIPKKKIGFRDNCAFFIIQDIKLKNILYLKNLFKKNNINISYMGDKDGHNSDSWIKFMKKFKIKFNEYDLSNSKKILNSSFFIEVNSL